MMEITHLSASLSLNDTFCSDFRDSRFGTLTAATQLSELGERYLTAEGREREPVGSAREGERERLKRALAAWLVCPTAADFLNKPTLF